MGLHVLVSSWSPDRPHLTSFYTLREVAVARLDQAIGGESYFYSLHGYDPQDITVYSYCFSRHPALLGVLRRRPKVVRDWFCRGHEAPLSLIDAEQVIPYVARFKEHEKDLGWGKMCH